MEYIGKIRKTGIRVRCGVPRQNKKIKVRTRNMNVRENNTGILQMKIEHGEMRPGPEYGGIDQSFSTRLHEV